MLLLDKNILITGASSGIGQAIAVQAAKQGARLILLARDTERLEATRLSLERAERHMVVSLDLSDHLFIYDLSAKLSSFGKISGYVHAAGVSPTNPLKLIKQEDVNACFQLNVYAALFITQLLMKPALRTSDAFSAVYISSVVSEVGEKGKTLYSMSKSALVGMAKSLALEYAQKKARFNCISPAVVETPLSQKSYYRQDPIAMEKILNKHPLGLGNPDDVAHAAVFLLSEQSKWITGINMPVDGGYLAK
jgi:NAD(P)-dependent dehydrogenase (short-subunit alcohol dehydrogenase family)